MYDMRWFEIVIQLCRMQVQREREKLAMTPKMKGALEALKKMQHHADEQAVKLTRRIENETMPALNEGFRTANANVDAMHSVVDGINEFAEELKNSNGGDPLDDSKQSSESNVTELAPRSSEVASR